MGALGTSIPGACERLSGIGAFTLRQFVLEAAEVTREPDVDTILDALVERIRLAKYLATGHFTALGALR